MKPLSRKVIRAFAVAQYSEIPRPHTEYLRCVPRVVPRKDCLPLVYIFRKNSKRCVSRPDSKAVAKKTERYQRIALEAAKQCGRGIIPKIGEAVEFSALTELISVENTGPQK